MTLRERVDSLFGRGPSSGAPNSQTAAPPAGANQSHRRQARTDRDRAVAKLYLPPSTSEGTVDGVVYWTFQIRCQLGRPYTLTAYFDGREYQVRVLEPDVVGKFSVVDGHVNKDGRLCLSPPNNGAESLAEAFSRSTIWATGFSIMQETGKFPFSIHNQ